MSLTGIRIEIVESHVTRTGSLTFGLILLAVLFPPIVLPLLFALAMLIVMTPALSGLAPVCIGESHEAPSGLSPRSPPLA
jgi:hypothetical protein